MKIAFCGPAGSGKTTLMTEIAKILELPKVYETVREWLSEHNITLTEIYKPENWKLLWQMQNDILDRKIKEESELKSFVSDRTVIDSYLYTKIHLRQYLSKIELSDYLDKCQIHFNRVYDLIFFVPLFSNKIKDDGCRILDIEYQQNFEKELWRILNSLENVYKIKSLSEQARLNEIIPIIRNRFKERVIYA